MIHKLFLYEINMKYVRNLAKVDDNVMSVSPQINKSMRPFVGILILVNGKEYCVPLSSPKPKFEKKKSAVDFLRIRDLTLVDGNGSHPIIGILNFNNMLPVKAHLLRKLDIRIRESDSLQTEKYKKLLAKQLDWCQKNEESILSHANKTYDLVMNHPEQNRNLVKRCCDFGKLEAALEKHYS